GKVSRLVDNEISVFDASWAPIARRYPATKRLIANLPSVEVGSVIEYSYVTRVTNAPAAFYGKWSFDSTEPVDRMQLWIDGKLVKETVRPPVIVSEPMMADGDLWQDRVIVSKGDWNEAAKILRKAARVDAYCEEGPWGRTMKSIRDWMAKNVKVAGPSLYETPVDSQLTPAGTVLKERYASRLDYVRTMCALLKGAGFNADIVFAAFDAGDPESIKNRDVSEKPNVRAFANPLVRVRETEGGWLWFGGDVKATYIGTENEYTPIGATPYADCRFFNPETCGFGVVESAEMSYVPSERNTIKVTVRENGAVDMDYCSGITGPGVAAFRKKYAEMLPEDRQRHYQKILGELAQSASATSELITDIEGYPATMRFSAYIPDYAVVNGDSITLTLAMFYDQMYPLSAGKRRYPIGISAVDSNADEVEIVFPEGYTLAEHLPEEFTFTNPLDPSQTLYKATAQSEIVDGRLVVKLHRERCKAPYLSFAPGYAQLFRDWSRTASSRSNRTITARKEGK
ncbi:MAG: DUF3857 domain-containing protein, partial [Kiritimatiellae bacterium]|nr:DUF3857 domain-containing protein [Kiritimatiellia bacterium]